MGRQYRNNRSSLNSLNLPLRYAAKPLAWLEPLSAPQKAKVLLIEDDFDIQQMLQYFVRQTGADLQILDNGRDAMTYIESSPVPNLVLLDRNLPGCRGEKVLKLIRSDQHWQQVPVIVLSAITDPANIRKVLNSGANAYVTKPFAPMGLIQQMRQEIARLSANQRVMS